MRIILKWNNVMISPAVDMRKNDNGLDNANVLDLQCIFPLLLK